MLLSPASRTPLSRDHGPGCRTKCQEAVFTARPTCRPIMHVAITGIRAVSQTSAFYPTPRPEALSVACCRGRHVRRNWEIHCPSREGLTSSRATDRRLGCRSAPSRRSEGKNVSGSLVGINNGQAVGTDEQVTVHGTGSGAIELHDLKGGVRYLRAPTLAAAVMSRRSRRKAKQ